MTQGDATSSAGLLDQIFALWVEPELQSRGESIHRAEVRQVLVVMHGNDITVRLNEEATFVAQIRATRDIEKGQSVFVEDFDRIGNLVPLDVHPDAGWIGFVQVGEAHLIAWDLRRNRRRAGELLDRADEFLDIAEHAAAQGSLAAAVENAFAAAELAVKALMFVHLDDRQKGHDARRRWWKDWTKIGNAPTEQGRCLSELIEHRAAARYADKKLRVKRERVERWIRVTKEMIADARAALADRLVEPEGLYSVTPEARQQALRGESE